MNLLFSLHQEIKVSTLKPVCPIAIPDPHTWHGKN